MAESETPIQPSGFRNFINNGLVQFLAGLSILYWILAYFVPGNILIEFVTMGLIGSLVIVVYRWAWVALADLAEGNTGGRAQLAVGILSLSLSTIGILSWSLMWRWSGYQQWMIDHAFLGFMRLWSVVGAGLMITAPGSLAGTIPRSNIWWLIAAIAIGAGLFGYSLGTTRTVEITSSPPTPRQDHRPICPPDEPVIVSRSGVYHDETSPSRSTVEVIAFCYATADEAKAAGFRPPAN